MKPRAVGLRHVGHLVDRVEVAGVHPAGIGDDYRGVAAQLGQSPLQSFDVHAAGRVASQLPHIAGPDPEHRQRLDGARVDVAAREDGDLRHARQPRSGDVLAVPLAAPVAGDRQAGEVGHRASGDQHAAKLAGQLEEVSQPVDADRLQAACQRGSRPRAGVLIERGSQPVGGDGRRRRAADHVVEEAGASRSRRRLAAEPSQVADRGQRAGALLGEGAAELRYRPFAAARLHLVAIQPGEELSGLRGCEV